MKPPASPDTRHGHYFIFLLLTLGLLLQACGGGDSGTPADPPTPPPPPLNIAGSGVKGPLANAIVTAYLTDTSQAGFKGATVDTASTGNDAAISGLALPLPLTPPYILEITSTPSTTDITTANAPVISTLRTVITQAMLDAAIPVYATPQTTLATGIAIINADSDTVPYTGNNDGTTTVEEFLNALPVAAAQVMSILGFGASANVDIFVTSPLINGATDTLEEQTAVAEYRTAIEALTALLVGMGNAATPNQSAEAMLAELINDLANDGIINGDAGPLINADVLAYLSTVDVATLEIAGSSNPDNGGAPYTVDEVEQILIAETATTGSSTSTTPLESITITPDADADDDTILDFSDNCPADANTDQADSNTNGVGDACDNPPLAIADEITVNEGGTTMVLVGGGSSVLDNDTDAENDTLTAVLDTDVKFGSLTLNSDGTFSYSHDGSENLTDDFSYHASDGTSNSNTISVSITITPVDDPALLTDDTNSITEDAVPNTVSGNVLANDSDPDTSLSVNNATALNGTGSYGSLTIDSTGAYTYLLDNNNPAVHALNAGETLTETYSYETNGQSADLLITIHGLTDGSPIDISGVWMGPTVVVSDPDGCSDGVGTSDNNPVSFTQTGTSLTAISSNGATLSGTINPVTGEFSFPLADNMDALSGSRPDLTQPGNDTAMINWSIDIDLTGTATEAGLMSGNISVTVKIDGQAPCTFTQTFTDNYFVYKHMGTENYSGIYATETLQTTIGSNGTFSSDREILVSDIEFTGSSFTIHLPYPPDTTNPDTYSNVSFDPNSGFFTYTVDWVSKRDTDGNPATIEESSVGHEVITGIFIADPSMTNGTDGAPLSISSYEAYERRYNGDVDAGGTPYYADFKQGNDYARRLTSFAYTRTRLKEQANQTDNDFIRVGVFNPPLKRVDPLNSKLYLEVLDGATVLCSVPYVFDGVSNGTYTGRFSMPHPSFSGYNFRGNKYSYVSCNTDHPVSGDERVFDGFSYTVRIVDTGPNGVNDGGSGDDVVNIIDANYAAEVVPPGERYSLTPDLFEIDVNGAKSSTTLGGQSIPLFGYFDPTEPVSVSWPAIADTNIYQIRVQERDEDFVQYHYNVDAPTTSVTIPAFELGDIQLLAINTATSNGAHSSAMSRQLAIMYGIKGLFNLELGNAIPIQYQTLQVDLQGDWDGISKCNVTNNPNISCNGGSINFGSDTVSLYMTDTTGLLQGAPGSGFVLELHFKTTGVITSGEAVVTSFNVTGISNDPTTAPTHARMVNPELRVRSLRYSNGNSQSYTVLSNPVDVETYDRAIFKVNDDSNIFVGNGGTDTGLISQTYWNGDFASQFSTYTVLPADDKQAQLAGRYVSKRTNSDWSLGSGLLVIDTYKAVLSNNADSNIPKMIFRNSYPAPDPSPYVAPVLEQVQVQLVNGGATINCLAATACDISHPIALAGDELSFNIIWTVPTPPAGSRWRLVARNTATDYQARTGRILPGPGEDITATDNGNGTTTYTWTHPGNIIFGAGLLRISIRVDDGATGGDFIAAGWPTMADQIYVNMPAFSPPPAPPAPL